MTRITSGLLKGKQLKVPDGIRPLTEKVRKAIFDSLGGLVEDARVLDLFSGSGAAGIEALSHGASSVTFVDKAPLAIAAIKLNTNEIDLARIEIIRADCASFKSDLPFDIVIADPPYKNMVTFDFSHIASLLAPGGIFILSHAKRDTAPEILNTNIIKRSDYGDTSLTYYQKPA